MKRRTLCVLGLSAAAAGPVALAQAPAGNTPPRRPAGTPWRLLVNEAVTGDTNIFLLTSRYQPLADYLGSQFKGRPAGIEPVVDIRRFMSLAQGETKPDLVFGKSVNQIAKLVRDSGYHPLVRRADPYKAAFIVPAASPFKTLADARGARIIMPDEHAATTAVARAELRRLNVAGVQLAHVKFQEAVAQQVQAGLAEIGVVNPSTARKWAEQGGRVLAETQPVVNWSVLGAPTLSADAVAQLREALMGMNTQAPAVIAGMGFKEWARAERNDYLALLDYTKE